MDSKYESLIHKIGVHFVNSKIEAIPADDIFKIPVIALFFTGSWCPPCMEFCKDLISFYNEANQKEKHFEIIQVSNEKSESIFKTSIETLPWVFVPYGESIIKEIVESFNVTFLPMFLIINKDGNLASDRGRKEIFDGGLTPRQLVDSWKSAIRSSLEKPIEHNI